MKLTLKNHVIKVEVLISFPKDKDRVKIHLGPCVNCIFIWYITIFFAEVIKRNVYINLISKVVLIELTKTGKMS